MSDSTNRRRFLGATAAIATALAGCSGSESGGSGGSGGSDGSNGSNGSGGSDGSTQTSTTGSSQTSAGIGELTGSTESSETSSSTQTSTASGGGEGSLELLESELVIDEGEYITDIAMTGLLENTGSGTLRVPELNVRFYDENDSVLDSTTASIAFLEPGDQWDVLSTYLQDTTPDRGEIIVESTEVFQTELGIPDPLELTDDSLETGTDPTISATLQNTSNSTIDVSAFAVFYEEGNVALGDGIDSLDGLAGGESWSVTFDSLITPEERAERVSDYTLYANVL